MVDAMARIAKYGKEHDQPVVINCSMGHNIGPHDGTDVLQRSDERYRRRIWRNNMYCRR